MAPIIDPKIPISIPPNPVSRRPRQYPCHAVSTGKNSTTIAGFLKICEYLQVTPEEFFSPEVRNTVLLDNEILGCFHRLTPYQSEYMMSFLKDLTRQK